ncbi:MAG: DHH family phosphoesterase [Clostridium sp.]
MKNKILMKLFVKPALLVCTAMILIYYEYVWFAIIIMVIFLGDTYYNTIKNINEEKSIDKFTSEINNTFNENLFNFSMPITIIDSEGKIIWHNNVFNKLKKGESLTGENIVKVVRSINIERIFSDKNSVTQRIKINNCLYGVTNVNVKKDDEDISILYFNEIGNLLSVTATKESVMLIEVDNINEALETTDENNKPLVIAEIDRTINAYANKLKAMIVKFDKNKYVLSVEDVYVEEEIEDKFKIIDEISTINKGNKIEITLSIGVGRGGISPAENFNFATVAKELALGRGGDQAVVKNNEDIKFFGGNTKEIEKRTRVRARVIAHALKELIYESSKIYIVGHTNPDMDCFGAAVGLSSAIRQLGKRCNIILNNDINGIEYFLNKLRKDSKYDNLFINIDEAKKEMDENALVIIVDVHNRSYISDLSIIEKAKKKVIIDHHRRSPDMVEGALLNYIEVYASSTSEMITEIIQYLLDKPKLSVLEAEGLLAGIFMDTKGFSFKTGVRTFEAASFLRNLGADTIEVKKMFTDNLNDYLMIAETIKSAQVENNIAIAISPKDVKSTVIVAKAADELLNISGILAGFVLAEINGEIYISGRSVGDINVQVMLEALGGGGHMNIAGAKVSNESMDEVIEKLKKSITKNLRVGD